MKKTTKRLVSILMALVMMVGLLPVTALADEWAGVTLTATASDKSKKLVVGETFTVTISLSNNLSTGISGVYYDVGFSKEDFELLDKVDGKKKTVSEADVFYTEVEVGETVVKAAVQHSGNIGEANTTGSISPNVNAAANTNDYTYNANGKLLTMTFKIKDGATPGEKKFTISNVRTTQDGTDPKPGKGDGCSVTLTAATSNELPVTIAKPKKGDAPETNITGTNYTGSITWDPAIAAGGKFAASKEYTANVTLTAKDGYQFAEGVKPTVAGADSVTGVEVKDSGNKLEFKATFPKTDTKTLKHIDIITNPDELKLAVPTAAPNATATKERPLVAIGIYDDGSDGPVTVTWKITTDPIPKGVSLVGSTLKVTNEAQAGTFMIKATSIEGGHTDSETVTITKESSKETHIVATAPTEGTNIAVPTSSTTTSGNCGYKVYDQYGAEMTRIGATWKMEPATVTGVTLTSDGAIAVNSDAKTCTVKLYATSGGVKSNEITFNIAREASVAKSLTIEGTADSVNVPTVTEPGTTECAYASYTATVKDQYGEAMTGETIEWSVTENPGVTFNNGQLTVTNKANADTVTITATSGTLTATKTVTINKDTAKVSIVKITGQDDATPVTIITCTGTQRLEYYTATAYDQYGKEIQDHVKWSLDPTTYSGVSYEISPTNDNIVTLKVAPNTAEGTFKLVATSQTVTTVKGELEIRVQEKNNVSSNINFDNGSLTYNGAGQEYKTAALDSSVTPGTGGAWTYTYTAGTGTLDTATGLPKTVGTYTVKATYEDSSNIGSKSATLTIEPREVAIPAADNTVFTYDGTEKTYNIPTSTDYTVSGNKQTNANETGYTVTVKLNDKTNTAWKDNTTADKTFTFKIMKATPTGEPKYTAITTSGKTLNDAALTTTGGTLDPNAGTLEWVDNAGNVLPTTTPVEANKHYKWVFTPTDTTNYKPLTGSFELWHKSTSSGGYYYAPTAAVVPDMPMLYRGCTGDAVKTLQDKLNALGYNSGSVDGIFGAKTYAAVTAFQKANSLGVDGIVGKLTWGKIYGVSPAMPVETTTVVGRPTVSYGSRGDAVRKLQELLNALGYDCGSVDGIFGSKTKAAVLAFQKANGLGVDGIVGPLTWGKLV